MVEQVRKKGFGRHSSFEITDEVLAEIQRLSSQGMNQGQIFRYFGVSEATWIRKRKKCPELLVAYNKGKSHGVDKASKVLMECRGLGYLYLELGACPFNRCLSGPVSRASPLPVRLQQSPRRSQVS